MHPAIIFGSIFGALALATNEDDEIGALDPRSRSKLQAPPPRPPRRRMHRGAGVRRPHGHNIEFGKRRRKPRPSPLRLPGGREIFEGQIKLNKKGNVARTWVFVRHRSISKMENAAADRGLKIVGEEYDADRVKAVVPILIPTPIGPIPYVYQGYVPYNAYIYIE